MAAPRLCSCKAPSRQLVEGIVVCRECGERIADPMLLSLMAEVRKLRRQVEALEAPRREPELVGAAELARRLGVSRKYVYRHADELGAVRIGDGPRPRLRFDPQKAAERLGKKRGRV